MEQIIPLTIETISLLENMGNHIITDKGKKYMHLPYWFKEKEPGIYVIYLPNEIPKDLKEAISPVGLPNGWIDVSDRKPDKVGKYLVHRASCNKTHFATWNGSMFAYNPDVTHWQPIPKSPTDH